MDSNLDSQPTTKSTPWPLITVLSSVFTLIIGITLGLYAPQLLSYVAPQPTMTETTQYSTPSPTLSPAEVSTKAGDPTADWKLLSFRSIQLKIPSDWWNGTESLENRGTVVSLPLNPTPLPYPSDAIPAFTINQEKNKTVQQKKSELIKSWGLTQTTENTVSIANMIGESIEGITEPGFLESRKMKWVLIMYQNNLYYFQDLANIPNHELFFDQILSTFTFTQ